MIDKKVNGVYNINMIYKNNNDLPKDRRRKAQIERILEVAMEIVTTDSVQSLTMKNLADKLDYTPGALYRYYSSKDQIISELQIKCIQEFNILFDESKNKIDLLINDNNVRIIALILAISELFGNYSFNEPIKFLFITNTIIEPKVLVNEEESLNVANEFKNLFFKIIIPFFQAITKKIMSDGNPTERALVYISSLQGVLQLKKLSRIDSSLFDLISLRKNLTKSLLLGWGVSEENLKEAESYLLKIKIIE